MLELCTERWYNLFLWMQIWTSAQRGSISVSRVASTHLAPSGAAVMSGTNQLLTRLPASVRRWLCVLPHSCLCEFPLVNRLSFSTSFQMLTSACCRQRSQVVCLAVLTLLGASSARVQMASAGWVQMAAAKVGKHLLNIKLSCGALWWSAVKNRLLLFSLLFLSHFSVFDY